MQIKHRSILKIIVLTIISFGIYPFVWFFKTRNEINSLGANIPSAWLMFVPFGFLYFYYRYSQDFSKFVRQDNLTLFYFLFLILPTVFSGPFLLSFQPHIFNCCWNPYILNCGIKQLTNYAILTFIPMMIFQLGLNELVESND